MNWRVAVWFLCVTQLFSAEKSAVRNEVLKSAEKAIAYAMQQEKKLTAQDLSTLIYLNDQFRLRLDKQKLMRLQSDRQPVRKTPLWRFADENFLASESEVKGMKGNDRITASALYCDKYVLPWDFYKELHSMAAGSDFDVTRAFLAIGLLKKRKCQFDASRIDPIGNRLRLALLRIAADGNAPETLQVEAILFLVLSGFRSDIQPEWIKRIISLQKADGRFGRIPYTTLLTARTLLEYSR